MPKKKRDYKDEYEKFQSSPAEIARRSARNKSVRAMGREGKASKDGKDVHHVDGNPHNRKKKNMRVINASKNRGMK